MSIEGELTEPQKRLVGMLQAWARTVSSQGRRYSSVPELVLDQGAWYRPASFPQDLEGLRGPARFCYANAALLAKTVPGLEYVEGFAVPGGLDLVVEHAWCVGEDSATVIDPTWDDEPAPAAYLGIALSAGYRARVLRERPAGVDSIAILDAWANPDLLEVGLPDDALNQHLI